MKKTICGAFEWVELISCFVSIVLCYSLVTHNLRKPKQNRLLLITCDSSSDSHFHRRYSKMEIIIYFSILQVWDMLFLGYLEGQRKWWENCTWILYKIWVSGLNLHRIASFRICAFFFCSSIYCSMNCWHLCLLDLMLDS